MDYDGFWPVDERELAAAIRTIERAGLIVGGLTLDHWEHLPEDIWRERELSEGRLVLRD